MIKYTFKVIIFMMSGLLFSCGAPEMPSEEILSEILKEEGHIAGISIGDTWEEIKTNCGDYWSIEEKGENNSQMMIRHLFGGDYDNQIVISFSFDPNNKGVEYIRCSIIGEGSNAIKVREMMFKIYDYYGEKYSPSGEKSWDIPIKGKEKPYQLECRNTTYKGDDIKETVMIHLEPPMF